jgi:hypothetical protein
MLRRRDGILQRLRSGLPELTRLADIACFFWHETCVQLFCDERDRLEE